MYWSYQLHSVINHHQIYALFSIKEINFPFEMSTSCNLRFHNIHARGITLSQDNSIARRVANPGFVFSSRPIEIDEKITIKLMELSTYNSIASAFCFGITHKNPQDEIFEEIREYTYLDLIKKLHYTALPIDKKLVTRNMILTFKVTQNEIIYETNTGEKGKLVLDKKTQTKGPMWALIYFFENPVSIKLIRNAPETKPTAPPLEILDVTPSTPPSDENECVICYERKADAVIYRCAHMCLCYKCAMELWKGQGDGLCPLCRAVIEDVIKPYK